MLFYKVIKGKRYQQVRVFHSPKTIKVRMDFLLTNLLICLT